MLGQSGGGRRAAGRRASSHAAGQSLFSPSCCLALHLSLCRSVALSPTAEEINKRPDEYWTLVMDIARKNNLKRVLRCTQIMGRSENDDLSAAQIFYPIMQAADIFFLKVGAGWVHACA